mgnify:FL=1
MIGDVDISMAEEILKASQSNLDSSRGDFSSETPKELTSLTAVQTAAKWGDESGPQAARTQYSTSICEMNTSVTQLNAEIIALLGGITTTISNFSANELESVEAVNYLSQQIEQAKLSANSASSQEVSAAISGAAAVQAAEALSGVLAGKKPTEVPTVSTEALSDLLQSANGEATPNLVATCQAPPPSATANQSTFATNPWSISQTTPQVPPMIARPTPSSTPTTPAWPTLSTPDDPFGVNLPGPIDQNLYH